MYKGRFDANHFSLQPRDQLRHANMVEDGHDAMVADVAQGFVSVVKNFYKSLLCNEFQS